MKRVISRTIKSYDVEVLCVHKSTKETFTENHTLSERFRSNEKLLNHLKEKINTDEVEAVAVLSISEERTQMYAMTEEDFVKHATAVEKRNEVK